ncbi:MAG: aminotransferase class I/II-fold pyridoxal phosphate-dependent enzyme [Deltaproteobacteria bacterium]|nr:aminotransferase class I/II-fold pyridoxal phosphate-dependent enzyme [Deltaproteobacteria bacterium]
MTKFEKLDRLPPYVLAIVNDLKLKARRAGEDVVDLGFGNPNHGAPAHVVEKLVEAARDPRNHHYSASRGLPNLRRAMSRWYARNFSVELDPETQVISTIGAKEGLSHFVLAAISRGDTVLCPDPCYPIHSFSVLIAGGDIRRVPLLPLDGLIERLEEATQASWPRPKMMIASFPHNPTTATVDLPFLARLVDFCRRHDLIFVHDLAYAEICYDGYRPPSALQVPGALDCTIEFTSLSKSHAMAGWRVGFGAGNEEYVRMLSRVKSYLDYGTFQPIQIATIVALDGPQDFVAEIVEDYRERRNALVDGLDQAGWKIEKPLGTMFVWAPLLERHAALGSLEFSKLLLEKADVAVAPGIGFGPAGEGFVRFALVENTHRIRQAVRNMRRLLRDG